MSVDTKASRSGQMGSVARSLQRLFMKGHVSLFRLTGGKVGGGEHMLILTTTGRKSGVERDTPLFFFADADRYIVIASNGGAPKHPVWWLNLQHNPQAKIQVGPRVIPVTAQQADPEERKRLWELFVQSYPLGASYPSFTKRHLPIVVLEPRA